MTFLLKRLPLLVVAVFSANLHAAPVTTVIDNWTTGQTLVAENTNVTSTVESPGSIGDFRTMKLLSFGNEEGEETRLVVTPTNNRLNLTSPEGPTPTFRITWGGVGGTTGLGGFDFGAGQSLDLFTSVLSFQLRSADLASNFTWEFTDTLNNTATYTGTLPIHSSASAPLAFDIALSSFANAPSVNWNSIDFIVFSGGDVSGLDMSLPASIQLVATVPEPRTWALLGAGLWVIALVVYRRGRRPA
jgi:hypothetical protein